MEHSSWAPVLFPLERRVHAHMEHVFFPMFSLVGVITASRLTDSVLKYTQMGGREKKKEFTSISQSFVILITLYNSKTVGNKVLFILPKAQGRSSSKQPGVNRPHFSSGLHALQLVTPLKKHTHSHGAAQSCRARKVNYPCKHKEMHVHSPDQAHTHTHTHTENRDHNHHHYLPDAKHLSPPCPANRIDPVPEQ